MGTAVALLLSPVLVSAQQTPQKIAQPLHAESSSTIDFSSAADGSETVEIRNVSHEVTGTQVPGRPPGERLVLRKTVRSKQVLGDIGMEATVTLEAWRVGEDLRRKPLYSLTVTGDEGHTIDNALFVVERGLEETEWWSVYKLGSGQHLFDTYVPLLSFSISRETVTTRYAGLEAPGDDTKDARLKQPNVVGVVTYASKDRIIREALVTCDDPKQAQLLRSVRRHHPRRFLGGRGGSGVAHLEAVVQPELPVAGPCGGVADSGAWGRSGFGARSTGAGDACESLAAIARGAHLQVIEHQVNYHARDADI